MINKVILVGNLTADPDVRATPKGVYVANVRLATNTYMGKDENGNAKQATEFHHLVFFGRPAEIAGEFLRKGRQIYVEGRLQTRQWDDKDGNKRYTTEIRGDRIVLLGGGAGRGGGGMSRGGGGEESMGGHAPASGQQDVPDQPLTDDDIPF